jgi:ribosome-associated protein
MDVAGLSPVCDYFVIASGTSPRQMRSVADDLAELAEKRNFAPLRAPKSQSDSWILVDCVDVLIHIFSEESRHYYDLENLWGDAKTLDWNREKKKKSPKDKE